MPACHDDVPPIHGRITTKRLLLPVLVLALGCVLESELHLMSAPQAPDPEPRDNDTHRHSSVALKSLASAAAGATGAVLTTILLYPVTASAARAPSGHPPALPRPPVTPRAPEVAA